MSSRLVTLCLFYQGKYMLLNFLFTFHIETNNKIENSTLGMYIDLLRTEARIKKCALMVEENMKGNQCKSKESNEENQTRSEIERTCFQK